MGAAFVIGGTGMVGRALVDDLLADGVEVLALARSPRASASLRDAGAEPIPTDLDGASTWRDTLQRADVIFHVGLPRQRPPLRRLGARQRARDAGRAASALAEVIDARTTVFASSALVYGDRGDAPADEECPLDPLPLGMAAAAAEERLRLPSVRVVRLPWVYGPGGWLRDLIVGLRTRRYRVVGDGGNRWGLLGLSDAVAALRAAAEAPPGIYNAIESAPTQDEVVQAICALPDFRQPDRVPVPLAGIPLGGALARSLAASVWTSDDRLRATGWSTEGSWREGVVSLTGVSLPPSA